MKLEEKTKRQHPVRTAHSQFLVRTFASIRLRLTWIYEKLSNVSVQIGLAIVTAIVMAIIWPRLFANDITTWHYFMSAVFQGLAALVSISLLAFFFLHERREAKIQALRNDCVKAAQQLSSSYPDYFDQGLLIEKLEKVRSIMDECEKTYHEFKGSIQCNGERPSKDDVRRAEEQWWSWLGPFQKVKEMLISLNRQKADAESLPRIVGAYIVPILLPLMFSLLMLATSDYSTDSRVRYTASVLIVLFLTLLVIARFGFGLSTSMRTQVVEDVPRGQEPQSVIDRMRRLDRHDRQPAFLIEWPREW